MSVFNWPSAAMAAAFTFSPLTFSGAFPSNILLAPKVILPPSFRLTLPCKLADFVLSSTAELPALRLLPASIFNSPLLALAELPVRL